MSGGRCQGVNSRRLGGIVQKLRSAGAVLLALVVFGLAVVVTLQLKHVGESGVRAERDLQAVATELNAQDSLEWQVISGAVAGKDAAQELEESRQRARLLIDQASGRDPDSSAQRLTVAHDQYAAAVDEELRLLAAGRLEDAEAFDEAEVDPAFEVATELLEFESREISAAATRAGWFSDAGLVATIVLSLAMTGVVQSRRKQAEVRREAERRGEARYRALVDQCADLVVVTHASGRTSYLSPSAERLFAADRAGASSGELDLFAFAHPEDRAVLAAALDTAGQERALPAALRFRGASGWRTLEVRVQDLRGTSAVGGLVVTGHDVTDRQALQVELEHRALHDALTELPNRALLADRFSQALRAADRDGQLVGLLLIDLDRFKEINDTLGHAYGDGLLRQVGPRLTGALRDVDTVARLGGDEFAVLLPDVTDIEAAVAVAGKLQAALGLAFVVDGVELHVEASIGVVVSGRHGTDASTLMQRADIAMYTAKRGNLGTAAYDPALNTHSPERLALLGDLRRALDQHELFLHFQPKVSLSSGQVCGAEALVRWAHPDRGLVSPDSFIPLAENTGLIGPLTHRVLDLALAQARRWADAGQPLQIAVNLSARNLLDPQLDTLVAELLRVHGVPAHLLKLEVTESAIMTDPVRAKALLDRLHAQGVALSIDDFGAGYTSIGQLRHLPIDELKIDRSFVMDMDTDSSNALIVRSVIELGHNLGLASVAEGVETPDALSRLTSYTCDVAQGYHLSRPLTAEAFDAWRATWTGTTPLTLAALPMLRTLPT